MRQLGGAGTGVAACEAFGFVGGRSVIDAGAATPTRTPASPGLALGGVGQNRPRRAVPEASQKAVNFFALSEKLSSAASDDRVCI